MQYNVHFVSLRRPELVAVPLRNTVDDPAFARCGCGRGVDRRGSTSRLRCGRRCCGCRRRRRLGSTGWIRCNWHRCCLDSATNRAGAVWVVHAATTIAATSRRLCGSTTDRCTTAIATVAATAMSTRGGLRKGQVEHERLQA